MEENKELETVTESQRNAGKGLFLSGIIVGFAATLLVVGGIFIAFQIHRIVTVKDDVSAQVSYDEGSAVNAQTIKKLQLLDNIHNPQYSALYTSSVYSYLSQAPAQNHSDTRTQKGRAGTLPPQNSTSYIWGLHFCSSLFSILLLPYVYNRWFSLRQSFGVFPVYVLNSLQKYAGDKYPTS